MKVHFRITAQLLQRIRTDLGRRHPHAHERVGFVVARPSGLAGGGLTLMAHDYLPVDDHHYADRPEVGAFVLAAGFRVPLQHAYRHKCSIFHVHMHEHRGPPWFGLYDMAESARFVPDFFNVAPAVPHGALILSHDQAAGLCWPGKGLERRRIAEVVEVGAPLQVHRGIVA